jgi:Domain of unknown function (DUF5916)/Carbohydrate family 9 binding domain-like
MCTYRTLFTFCILTCLTAPITAQQPTKSAYQDSFQVTCARATEPVKIDGFLTESVWKTAQKASNFYTKWPRAGEPALLKTEVQLATDGKFLYIAATCYGTGKFIIQSLKRDVGYWSSDGMAVVLDPTNQSQKGYFFGVNQVGAQTEGLYASPGDDDNIFTWDNRWSSEVHTEGNDFFIEMAIPFAILRFSENTEWGIQFIRNDPGNGFWHTWTNIPLNFDGTDLGYAGLLKFEANEAPSRTKKNYNISPYLSSGYVNDRDSKHDLTATAGIDAKVGIGSGLNLDLTVNPDFSQVEVDEQVVNLTRFDIGLPEKRTFFLENADIFGGFGIPPIRPFFSRRIGLDPNGVPQRILYGARLTGALDAKTQIGVLNMQTANSDQNDGQNFSAVTARRVLFGRTTLGGYFHNRQNVRTKDAYRRNAGAELLFNTPNGRWSGWLARHQSFEKSTPRKSGWTNSGFGFFGARFDSFLDFVHMGENYRADMGLENRIENYDAVLDTTFRIGYQFFFNETNIRFPVKKASSPINLTRLQYQHFHLLNPDATRNEINQTLEYSIQMKNTMDIVATANVQQSWVPVAFRFDGRNQTDCPALPAGYYRFSKLGLGWESDGRKKLGIELGGEFGGFYNGTIKSASMGLNYRLQPYGKLSLSAQYNDLDFPEPYCDVRVINVTPRIEVFFNRNLNWTVFTQYNNQANALNLNSRIQWRFRPMSDLFLVYTYNAQATNGQFQGNAFIAKVNYWL